MKHNYRKYLAACALIAMSACCLSCYKSADEAQDEDPIVSGDTETRHFTFTDLSVTKNVMPEYGSSSSSKADESDVNYLMVVDIKDGRVCSLIQRSDPVNHAVMEENVEMYLQDGTHDIYFIASENQWHEYDLEKRIFRWDSQTAILKNVWVKHVELKVDENTDNSKSIKMDRCVGYVRMEIEDALPDDLAGLQLSLDGGSWEYSLDDRAGTEPAIIARNVSVPTSYRGKTGVATGIFTFLPKGSSSAQRFTVSATSSSGLEIARKSFEKIPLQVNRQTTRSAKLFSE